jgi:hypothetical protein
MDKAVVRGDFPSRSCGIYIEESSRGQIAGHALNSASDRSLAAKSQILAQQRGAIAGRNAKELKQYLFLKTGETLRIVDRSKRC